MKIMKTEHPEYWILRNDYNKCNNPNHKDYKYYGGRGIKVCQRWRDDFNNFLEDMGSRPSPQHTLERINNDGDYEPSNCRWATRREQANNRRVRQDNKSGISGVSWYERYSKWSVRKNIDGKRISLGYFSTLDDAKIALSKYGF